MSSLVMKFKSASCDKNTEQIILESLQPNPENKNTKIIRTFYHHNHLDYPNIAVATFD